MPSVLNNGSVRVQEEKCWDLNNELEDVHIDENLEVNLSFLSMMEVLLVNRNSTVQYSTAPLNLGYTFSFLFQNKCARKGRRTNIKD